MLLLIITACTGPAADTGADCGSGDPALVIGSGVGDVFTPYEDGAVVGLSVAPQGGFGVAVRASTTGLVTDDVVDVLLETRIDGALVGSFLNEQVTLYCQDDGSGLLWGVVVGFDPAVYATNDDLLALDGQEVELVVTAMDTAGAAATGTAAVIIDVGG